MSTVVGRKGQVTIERAIRQALGIEAGFRVSQHTENGAVVLRFLPPRHHRSLAGALASATTISIDSEDALRQAVEEAWSLPDCEPAPVNAEEHGEPDQ